MANATMLIPQSLVEHIILCDGKKLGKTKNIHTDLVANQLIKTATKLNALNSYLQVAKQTQLNNQDIPAMQDMQLVVTSPISIVRPSNPRSNKIDKCQAMCIYTSVMPKETPDEPSDEANVFNQCCQCNIAMLWEPCESK